MDIKQLRNDISMLDVDLDTDDIAYDYTMALKGVLFEIVNLIEDIKRGDL